MVDILEFLPALVILVGIAVLCVVVIIAWCKLAGRLGYDPMMGILMLIPVVNLVVFLYWAFKESPNEKRIRILKSQRSGSLAERVSRPTTF